MNLAAYARYSSDNQREESIDEQFREIQQWSRNCGHQIVMTYFDSALSGKFDYRPEFERMLSDAKRNLWDGVVVFDLSRFSRGGEYGIVDSLRLQDEGKALLSVTEQFGNDFGGKIIKHIKMLYNENYIEQLSANVKRGHKQNALLAQHNGGTPPLGYDVDKSTRKLIINELESDAVRQIFSMFAQNKSYKEIADALNERGFRTKRNRNRFNKNSLYEILGNKKYIGIYEYGKIATQITGRTKKFVPVAPEKVIIIEAGCPSIIEKSLFEKVQKMRELNQHTFNPRAEVDYLLRGKLRCSQCGGAYVGSSTKSHGEKCWYYVCSGKKNGKECSNRNIKKDVIENRVIEEIKTRYLSDEGIAWVYKQIQESNKKAEMPIDVKECEAALTVINQLERKLKRQKEAFYDGIIEIAELKADKEKIEKEIETQKQKLVNRRMIELDENGVANILEQFKKDLTSNKELINTLVESVVIDGENITVTLYSTPFDKNSTLTQGNKKSDPDNEVTLDKDNRGGGGGN